MSGFDPETGEMLDEEGGDRLQAALRRIETLGEARQLIADDLARAERDLRRVRRERDAARAELERQREEADEMPEARTLFKAWVQATGRNPKVTKFGPARQKAVIARMREGRDFERILRAVTIGAQAANVSDRQAERLALIAAMKYATDVLPDDEAQAVRKAYKDALPRGFEKYDDLELICRNEVNFERFAAYADKVAPAKEEAAPTLPV